MGEVVVLACGKIEKKFDILLRDSASALELEAPGIRI